MPIFQSDLRGKGFNRGLGKDVSRSGHPGLVLSASSNCACLLQPNARHAGRVWLHEIKHDGFRILARRDSAGVRLITRAGNNFSSHFPFIAMAAGKLPVRSCLIDGEAIVCNENGLAVFELIRRHGAPASAVHCAFDLLELDGRDLRQEPIEKRKALLAKLLRGSHLSIVFNEYFEEDGAIVFREACRLGCEGVVSKRLGSAYRSGRSAHWVKIQGHPLQRASPKRTGDAEACARECGTMREVLIVAITGFLAGIIAAGLLVHFLP